MADDRRAEIERLRARADRQEQRVWAYFDEHGQNPTNAPELLCECVDWREKADRLAAQLQEQPK